MKNRIIALLLAVAMIVNVNELSYLTVHAASTEQQTVATENLIESDTTTPSDTEGSNLIEVEDTSNEMNQNETEDNQVVEEKNDSQTTITDTSAIEENANVVSDINNTNVTEDASSVTNESEATENGQSTEDESNLDNKNMQDIPADTTVVYTYDTLDLDKTVTASVGVEERYYLFQPTESGWYDFKVEGEQTSNVVVYVFHADTQTTEILNSEYYDYGIFCELTGGNSYLFNVDKDSSYSSQITINKMSPITGISVTAPTVDSLLGDSNGLNLNGMQLTVQHEDGSVNTKTNENKSFIDNFRGQSVTVTFNNKLFSYIYQSLVEGTNRATVTYMGQTTTVDINFVKSPISKIEILSNPTKMTYYSNSRVNAYVNLNGLKIRSYDLEGNNLGDFAYSFGSDDIKYCIVSANGDDIGTSTYQIASGDYDIRISYGGCSYLTTNQPLHILEKSITSVEISKAPNKTIYYDLVDTNYSLSGLELTVHYSDNSSEIVSYNGTYDMSSNMEDNKRFRLLSPSDTPYHVEIEYMGYTVIQDIYIKAAPISNIKIIKTPTKTTYMANGEYRLNLNGMQIEVTYTDGREPEIISAGFAGGDGFYIQGDNNSINWDTVGSQTATISYMGVEATYNIEIIENDVSSIKVNQLPNKMEYIANVDHGLDMKGLTFNVTYKNGEVKTLEAYCNNNFSYNYSGNLNEIGKKTVTILYLGAKATFEVSIINNPVKSISVSKAPTKATYILGADDSISLSGIEFIVDYGDKSEVVDPYHSDYYINILNQHSYLASSGTKDVTIKYMGYTATFPITVEENPIKSIAVSKLPTKVNYIVGADKYLSKYGLELEVTDQNDNTKIVAANNETGDYRISVDTSRVDLTTIGTKTVKVTYMGRETSFDIQVIESPIKSIVVSKLPTKVNYIIDVDKYVDTSELEIMVTDQNDNTKKVSEYSHTDGYQMAVDTSKVDLTTLGAKTVYVTYMGCETSFEIQVVENPVTNISISQLPTKTKYIVNYENYLDLSGLKLKVDSINETDTFEYYYSSAYAITTNKSSIDWSTTGVKTVIVYYMNRQTSFNIEVIDNPISSISLDTQNVRKNYYTGADGYIDYDDLKFTVHYKTITGMSDVTYDMVDMDDMEYFDVNFNHSTDSRDIPEDLVAGIYPVTISYMGITADYNVNILANPVESIDILEQPTITNYFDFEVYDDHEFDLNGLEIRINYNNGTDPVTLKYDEYKMNLNGYSVSFQWKNTTANEDGWSPCTGNNAIVISYMGVTKEIPITVLSTPVKSLKVISAPTRSYNKLWYSDIGSLDHSSIDLSGLELEIAYDDNSTHTFTIAKDDYSDSRIVNDNYKRSIKAYCINDKIELKYMNQTVTYAYSLEEADWGSALPLNLDTPVVSNIQNTDEGILYQFTPNKSGTYKIYSYGDFDTKVYLYDSNKKLINKNDDISDSNYDFCLSQNLISGQTYYFAVKAYKACTFHTVISLNTASDINTKSPVSNIAVTDLSVPKLNETPDRGATIGENQECKISNITWSGIDKAEKFKPATKYTAYVTLKPTEGFQFTSATTASINGKRIVSKRFNSDGTFTISYTFDYTDCQITIPTSDNYVIKGESSVAYGSSYTFSIAYANGYNSSDCKIKANGSLLHPDGNGNYMIHNVKENQTIAVKNSTSAGNGEYSLIFKDKGNVYDIINVKAGSKVSSLNAPENVLPVLESTDSEFFMGWYDSQGVRFTSNTVVSSNKELYAKYCDRVITSIYNGYTIYYKILSIDENNRVKVQVGTGTGIAVQQAVPSTGANFINPLMDGNGSMIVVPSSFTSTLEGNEVNCDVMSVANNAFSNSTATSILLPNTVESIGSGAFSGCTSLTSITVPNSIQTIESSTFNGCTALTQVTLPTGITSIEDSAFSGCSQLTTLTIPSTIENVSNTAFENAGTAQSGTQFICDTEVSSVLSNAGIASDKIIAVTLTLDYEYNDLKLTKTGTKVLTVNALEGASDVSSQVTWTTSDVNCISLSNSTGNTTTLTANQETNSDVVVTANYKGITTSVNVNVVAGTTDISADNTIVISDIASQTYTGSAITPAITISKGGTELSINTDYEVSYSNNINAGAASVTITGKGSYTGTVTKAFTINAESITNCNITDLGSQTYTGSSITPTITISKAATTLSLNTDYEVSYSNNTNAGTASVSVTGKGNYTGTVTKTFSINAKSITNCNITELGSQTYTGSAITPAIAISQGATALSLNTDYEVSYSNNTNAGTASVSITGKGNYAGTVTKAFTINAESITNCNITDLGSQTYTGSAITPAITISKGGTALSLNTDYEVTYSNNTNAGTASVSVTGKGNYAGTVTKTFTIAAKKIESVSVDLISDIWYTGAQQVPTPTVKDGNSNLAKDKDYTLSYSNNTNAGTATITVIGIGNYAGNKNVTFKIISKLDKVGNLTASNNKTKSIELTWDNVSCANGYEIYRYNASKKKYTKIGTSSQNSYTSKKLSAGTSYKYKVRAYRKVNGKKVYGKYSNILKTGTCTTKPSISAKKGKKSAIISWKKVKGSSGYEIYMSTSKNGNYEKVATLKKSSKVSYTKKKLKKGKTYYFKVRTYSKINKVKVYSDYSSVKSVKVK